MSRKDNVFRSKDCVVHFLGPWSLNWNFCIIMTYNRHFIGLLVIIIYDIFNSCFFNLIFEKLFIIVTLKNLLTFKFLS